ncbi:MAG: HDIG domain-containing metalloprotein [Chlamydiota bacterium]
MVVSLFILLLTAFLHLREAKIDNLEIGDFAPRFLISQVDFSFPDEEATRLLKQDSAREMGLVYKLNERQIVDTRFSFENFLIQNSPSHQLNMQGSFEHLYKATDTLEDVLVESRFTDGRTLQKMRGYGIATHYVQPYVPPEVDTALLLPQRIWQKWTEIIAQKMSVGTEQLGFIIEFFSNRSWEIEEDRIQSRALRMLAERSIPEKMTRVRAGTKIIDQGEKVTQRHIVMLQAMKAQLNEDRMLWEPLPILSSFILSLLFVGLSGGYLFLYKKTVIQSLNKLSLLLCVVTMMLLFAKITEFVILGNSHEYFNLMRYPVILPFAAILIVIFLQVDVAFFASSFLSVILSMGLVVEHTKFLILNLTAALVVVTTARALRKRKEVFLISAKVYFAMVPILLAFSFADNSFWSASLSADLGFTCLFIFAAAILVVGILPILESLFQVMTEMSLMEYMDPNNELIRRLAMETPGTYQHCLVLGNLSEAMAQAIGADGLFCRVATLYHDIGKLNNPQFFMENQPSGVNIHQLLTPKESAEVIISHVSDGVAIGKKYHLPEVFLDVIREHHGTTLTYFFYHKELEVQSENHVIEENAFRYPGPKPRSKESAIIMIADSIEAASRSLENFSEESLRSLVEKMVQKRIADGQLADCSLTFAELGMVQEALVQRLLVAHHMRIKYPDRDEKKNSKPENSGEKKE